MEANKIEELKRELEAVKHLTFSRGKQIKALQDRVEGEVEVNRMLATFLPLLALAVGRDSAAGDAVRVTGSKDVICVSVDKKALVSVLGRWQLKTTVHTEAEYRLAFEKTKQKSQGGVPDERKGGPEE